MGSGGFRRVATAVSLSLLVTAGAVPAPALAGDVFSAGPGVIRFTSSAAETNVLTVSFASGQITINDSATPIMGFDGTICSKPDPNTVTCTANSLNASLGTQDDSLTMASALPGFLIAFGDEGNDTLTGGPGAEQMLGEAGTDSVSGGDGNDNVGGGLDNDAVDGGAGDDTLEGAATVPFGDDVISGGPGNDTLGSASSADGRDSFSGGDGRDGVDYSARPAIPLSITFDGSANDGQAGEQDNVGADVEDATTAGGNDTVVGTDVDNALAGGGGEDIVTGGGGNDGLDGGPDADTLEGGDGNDSVVGANGDDAVLGGTGDDSLDGGGGTDSLSGSAGDDRLLGGAGIDALAGGDGNDVLIGGAPGLIGADGDDNLKGEAGNDTLMGDAGDDTLDGGSGEDQVAGGEGDDTVDYQRVFESVSVSLDGFANDGAALERDNVGTDVENMRGGRFGDDLTGDQRSNLLDGGSGEDYVDGSEGRDDIIGGQSGDVLRSRDRAPDRVACGEGPDFVVADGADVPEADCDRVDRGKSRPSIGKTFVVRPLTGTLGMSPKGIRRSVPLKDTVGLPVGSTVASGGGVVSVTSAKDRRRRQSARFFAGSFQLLQKRGRRPITELVLKGGDFGKCPRGGKGGRAGVAQRRRTVRRLWGNGRGRFRTRGRYSAATVRGTKWLTEDRCDGTLTRVTRGTAVVRDFARRRTVVVRAGRRYLAKAPPRR